MSDRRLAFVAAAVMWWAGMASLAFSSELEPFARRLSVPLWLAMVCVIATVGLVLIGAACKADR